MIKSEYVTSFDRQHCLYLPFLIPNTNIIKHHNRIIFVFVFIHGTLKAQSITAPLFASHRFKISFISKEE